jgi:hypothetical protein
MCSLKQLETTSTPHTKDAHMRDFRTDFTLNAHFMSTCPNGPGAGYDSTNYIADEWTYSNGTNIDDVAYYQEQERQGDLYQVYGSDLQLPLTSK